MKLILYSLAFIICLKLIDGDNVRFRCDYNYNSELGWFKYHEIPATWYDARLQCALEGGILASPTTSEIGFAMLQEIKQHNIFTGIHAIFSKGQYYTVDGIPLAEIPHRWQISEPDNKNNAESCLIMSDYEFRLSDVKCDEPRPYICYREKSNIDVTICGTPDPEYHIDNRTNKCYKVHTEPRTFARAHFVCSAEGGHLAIINSEEEANVIRDLFALYPPDKMIGSYYLKDVAFIGFHNWGEGGDWRTIHGQKIQDAGYAKFGEGQPDNSTDGEYCGSVFRNGLLNDLWCEKSFAFICEKRPDYPAVCKGQNNNVFDRFGN